MLTYLCILRDTLYYTRFFLQHQWTSWGRSREADSATAFTTASKAKFVVVKSGFSLLLILDEGRSKILHIAYLYTIYLLLIYLSIANVLYLVSSLALLYFWHDKFEIVINTIFTYLVPTISTKVVTLNLSFFKLSILKYRLITTFSKHQYLDFIYKSPISRDTYHIYTLNLHIFFFFFFFICMSFNAFLKDYKCNDCNIRIAFSESDIYLKELW